MKKYLIYHFFSIGVGKNTEISLGGHFIFNKESETNIRKVIRDNTPLISKLDEIDKIKDAITKNIMNQLKIQW